MSSHVGEERLKEERDLIYQRQKHCWPAPPVEELSLSHVWNIQKGLHVSHTSSSLPGRCLVFNGMCSFILRSGFDSCGDSNTAFVLQGSASQVRDHGHSCRHVNVLWTLKCLFCSNNNLCSNNNYLKISSRGLTRALDSKCCPWTAAGAALESLLEMQIPGPNPGPTEPVRSSPRPSGDSPAH